MSEQKPIDLEAIRARANAATPGPWITNKYGGIGIGPYGVGESVISADGFNPFYELGCPYFNAEFIAHSRQDIPALCDEVESLRERLKELDGKGEEIRKEDTRMSGEEQAMIKERNKG